MIDRRFLYFLLLLFFKNIFTVADQDESEIKFQQNKVNKQLTLMNIGTKKMIDQFCEETARKAIESMGRSPFNQTAAMSECNCGTQDILDKIEELKSHQDIELRELKNSMNNINDKHANIEEKIDKAFVAQNSPSTSIQRLHPRDCAEIDSSSDSGIYTIQPQSQSFQAFCDMKYKGGGWTVLQHRFDGSVDFYRNWQEYKNGFGNMETEFWLGLDHLYDLTNAIENELVIELEDFDNVKKFAKYSEFAIGSEKEGYVLKLLGKYSGDAGDSFRHHKGCKFSTKDKDLDESKKNCAEIHHGAWWYRACHFSNLNGYYLGGETLNDEKARGVEWFSFHGHNYSLKVTTMKIRPIFFKKI